MGVAVLPPGEDREGVLPADEPGRACPHQEHHAGRPAAGRDGLPRRRGAAVFEAYNVYVGGRSRYPASIPDGTSNTIFWTETLVNCVYPYTWCQNTVAWNLWQWSFIAWYKAPPIPGGLITTWPSSLTVRVQWNL